MTKPVTIPDIQKRLEILSQELIALIQQYQLDAQDPLDVIPVAREKVSQKEDYIRFLELSLEGRLLGEAAQHLEAAHNEN
ncbi:hypothetical protein WH95_07995 [Kiloniella litopenaei]|uniref:Uncharacterized protein n=1 Tax=Kiloniella litopenaei TaxID=1549748 RepID=A0A0M2R6T1_9PROT|nr:hypothetical protein [Kiloniella litopenaei]KKJ77602.1 hypothetical protein WH95_07995 [Kiloniella litopenaei]